MRTPADVRRPEPLVTFGPGASGFCHCSFHGRCVLVEFPSNPGSSYRVFALDPMLGRGEKLTEFPSTSSGANLTPDGEHLAYTVPEQAGVQNRIRIVSFHGEPAREIVVKNNVRLVSLDSSPAGGFLSSEQATPHRELLFITPEGGSNVLWAPERMDVWTAQASPDGRRLAISGSTYHSNVWLVDRR